MAEILDLAIYYATQAFTESSISPITMQFLTILTLLLSGQHQSLFELDEFHKTLIEVSSQTDSRALH